MKGASPRLARARAWCRVDLAGGTLDIWPLGLLHPGAVTVNVAVDLAVRVELRLQESGYRVEQGGSRVETRTVEELSRRPETALIGLIAVALELPPFGLEIVSDSPRGGGLGASSALAVATIAAAQGLLGRDDPGPDRRAALARDLEARLMGLPTGRQDHFPALLGGALAIAHRPGGETVRPLATDLGRLGDSLLVAYSGESHLSAATNWQIVRRRLEGDPEIVELFAGIAGAAAEAAVALEAGDLPRVGELMSREWSFRRRLAEGVATPQVERLLAAGARHGAWGGKVCGAGGGGCIALLAPPDERVRIARHLETLEARVLPARPAAGALSVELGDE